MGKVFLGMVVTILLLILIAVGVANFGLIPTNADAVPLLSRKCGHPMCDKCVELDRKIEHYRKLASAISDRLTVEGIADLIKELEARKLKFHPEQNE